MRSGQGDRRAEAGELRRLTSRLLICISTPSTPSRRPFGPHAEKITGDERNSTNIPVKVQISEVVKEQLSSSLVRHVRLVPGVAVLDPQMAAGGQQSMKAGPPSTSARQSGQAARSHRWGPFGGQARPGPREIRISIRQRCSDSFHAIDSRPVWWTCPEPGDWSLASAGDLDFARGLISSLVISVVVSRSTRWGHTGGRSGLPGAGWNQLADEAPAVASRPRHEIR